MAAIIIPGQSGTYRHLQGRVTGLLAESGLTAATAGGAEALDRLRSTLRDNGDISGPLGDIHHALLRAGDALGVYGHVRGVRGPSLIGFEESEPLEIVYRCPPAAARGPCPARPLPLPGAGWRARRCAGDSCDMGGFLDELGKKLADRWLQLLVLPGAFYLAMAIAARTLGQSRPFDLHRLITQVITWAKTPAASTVGGQVVLLGAALAGSAAVGLAAQALGSLAERLTLAAGWSTWKPPLRQLAQSRVHSRRAPLGYRARHLL